MATPAEPSTTPSAIAATERPFQFRLVYLLVPVAILGALLGAIVPALRYAHRAVALDQCYMRQKWLILALHNYHDCFEAFPPAHHVDANGRRTHSWRAMILPFVESNKHFQEYRFSEPWNGPNNSRLTWLDMPKFTCPGGRDAPGITNYVAVVGNGTAWPGARAATMSDITDGASNTLMIVEIAHSDIHWMEPRDLPVEELAAWLDPQHRPQLLGNHIEGGMVAYADGHVEMLSRDVTIERLKALVTAAGKDNR